MNNLYGKHCSTIEELLNIEIEQVNEIWILDSSEIDKIDDNHFHSSDEKNIYY